ncbi:hypothetical protein DFH06DRAFT_1311750 [Mycena polygramma]|nr:hypothetical protein DFH06DRAFT_1311750 [Mycena polygramma]
MPRRFSAADKKLPGYPVLSDTRTSEDCAVTSADAGISVEYTGRNANQICFSIFEGFNSKTSYSNVKNCVATKPEPSRDARHNLCLQSADNAILPFSLCEMIGVLLIDYELLGIIVNKLWKAHQKDFRYLRCKPIDTSTTLSPSDALIFVLVQRLVNNFPTFHLASGSCKAVLKAVVWRRELQHFFDAGNLGKVHWRHMPAMSFCVNYVILRPHTPHPTSSPSSSTMASPTILMDPCSSFIGLVTHSDSFGHRGTQTVFTFIHLPKEGFHPSEDIHTAFLMAFRDVFSVTPSFQAHNLTALDPADPDFRDVAEVQHNLEMPLSGEIQAPDYPTAIRNDAHGRPPPRRYASSGPAGPHNRPWFIMIAWCLCTRIDVTMGAHTRHLDSVPGCAIAG